jgi:hypothetical protein
MLYTVLFPIEGSAVQRKLYLGKWNAVHGILFLVKRVAVQRVDRGAVPTVLIPADRDAVRSMLILRKRIACILGSVPSCTLSQYCTWCTVLGRQESCTQCVVLSRENAEYIAYRSRHKGMLHVVKFCSVLCGTE